MVNVTGWLGAFVVFCLLAALVSVVFLVVYQKVKKTAENKQHSINYMAYFCFWTTAILAFGIFRWEMAVVIWAVALTAETLWLRALAKKENVEREEQAKKHLRGRKRERALSQQPLRLNLRHCLLAQCATLLCICIPMLCVVIGVPQVEVRLDGGMQLWAYGFLCISGFICAVYASGMRGKFQTCSPFIPAEDRLDKAVKILDFVVFLMLFIFLQGLWIAICFLVQ